MKSIAKANLVKKNPLFRQKHLFYENCDQFFRTWGHPDGNGTCTPLVNQKSEARNDMIFANLETWRHVRGTGWMGKKSCSKSCREACPVWGNFQQHRFRNKCLTVIHLYLNTYHLYMYKMCIYIYTVCTCKVYGIIQWWALIFVRKRIQTTNNWNFVMNIQNMQLLSSKQPFL